MYIKEVDTHSPRTNGEEKRNLCFEDVKKHT